MEDRFCMIIEMDFDNDIHQPYHNRIVDIEDVYNEELNNIYKELINEFNGTIERYRKEDEEEGNNDNKYKIRFLEKCVAGIMFCCVDTANDVYYNGGNWEFEIKHRMLQKDKYGYREKKD